MWFSHQSFSGDIRPPLVSATCFVYLNSTDSLLLYRWSGLGLVCRLCIQYDVNVGSIVAVNRQIMWSSAQTAEPETGTGAVRWLSYLPSVWHSSLQLPWSMGSGLRGSGVHCGTLALHNPSIFVHFGTLVGPAFVWSTEPGVNGVRCSTSCSPLIEMSAGAIFQIRNYFY